VVDGLALHGESALQAMHHEARTAVATQMTCSDVELHPIAEAGHSTLLEQPEALPQIMIDCLTPESAR